MGDLSGSAVTVGAGYSEKRGEVFLIELPKAGYLNSR
jgi:hypothetical protein